MKHSEENNGPHIDRWHYLDYRDDSHSDHYIEWKYFNFTQGDLMGYIVYYILDPEAKSHTEVSGGRLLVRVFKNNAALGLVKKIPVERIEFDPISANVSMAGATIVEKDSHHYDLTGDFKDISWKISYKQSTPSIVPFYDVNPGLMRWENASWLIKMPQAKVQGEINIGKEKFILNGTGYSDTNWGEIMPFLSRYEWGQYNHDSLAFVFGILYKLWKVNHAYFYMTLNGEDIKFKNPKVHSRHTAWAKDKNTGVKIPVQTEVIIENKDYTVKFTTKLITQDSLGLKIGPFLPKSVVLEEIAEYTGTILKQGKIIHEFHGKGFQEWSTKTWKNLPIMF